MKRNSGWSSRVWTRRMTVRNLVPESSRGRNVKNRSWNNTSIMNLSGAGRIDSQEIVQSLRDLGVNISEEQAEKILKRWERCCELGPSTACFSTLSFYEVTWSCVQKSYIITFWFYFDFTQPAKKRGHMSEYLKAAALVPTRWAHVIMSKRDSCLVLLTTWLSVCLSVFLFSSLAGLRIRRGHIWAPIL